MPRSLGFWLAHLNVPAVCGVVLGAFVVQFVQGELPCPLCLLQRMAMLLCALGPASIILRARAGEVTAADVAAGYGLSVLAAVGGACISARQVLLHVVPPDPGYGGAVLGLHLYTWALIVFGCVLVVSGLNLVFLRELGPQGVRYTRGSVVVIGLLGAVILANALAAFAQEGLHWTLADNPERYRLWEDIRGIGGSG